MNPFDVDAEGLPVASEAHLELASIGALLVNELVADSRGMVEKPMAIQFLAGAPKVELYALPDDGSVLRADRTGVPPGEGGTAA